MKNMVNIKGRVLNKLRRILMKFINKNVQKTLNEKYSYIKIGDKYIENIKPLGGYYYTGISKVGRISFSGYCEGNKVKIYEAHSKEQIKLRLYVQNDNNLKEYFPSIIAYNDRYIVEEWVSIDKEKDNLEDKQAQVFKILSILHSTNLPKDIRGGFCYLFDYLLPRVEKWSVFQKVEDFVKDWNDEFLKNSHNIESKISHPDLHLGNIVKCSRTMKYKVIDNELLGYGKGWVLDALNAGFKDDKLKTSPIIYNTWKLRCVGRLLDDGFFNKAFDVIDDKLKL